MHHNARLQHLVHANQCLLHSLLPHYDLFMHARPALSHPCLQHYDSMCDEIAELGAAGGEQSEPPCLYIYICTMVTVKIKGTTCCLNNVYTVNIVTTSHGITA